MKKLIFIILFLITGILLFTESIIEINYDFLQNEERIIKENQLISKQEAAEIVIKYAPTYYPKMDKTKLKQMLNIDNAEVILVEEITPTEAKVASVMKYYYTVNLRFPDGRVMLIECINAETGKGRDSVIIDDEPERVRILMTRNEIIEYIKKHFSFPENAKIKIEAVFDYSFYMYLSLPSLSSQWKYRVTIQDGLFTSASYPDGIATLYISPYIDGRKGIRETPAADNAPGFKVVPHRIFVKHTEVPSQKTLMAAESSTGTADVNETGPYYGVD